ELREVTIMGTAARRRISPDDALAARVESIDWPRVTAELDGYGCARLGQLLTAAECAELAGLYADDGNFRSTVVMARHGFGQGEYKYLAYPLPAPIAALRPALYTRLVAIANRWNEIMGIAVRYPPTHAAFIKRCHDA